MTINILMIILSISHRPALKWLFWRTIWTLAPLLWYFSSLLASTN